MLAARAASEDVQSGSDIVASWLMVAQFFEAAAQFYKVRFNL